MKSFFGLMLTLFAVLLFGFIPAGADDQRPEPGQSFKDCATDCPEMVIVPAGSFNMGSPVTEPGRQLTEAPQHAVTIAKPFAVSKFVMTFAEWDACTAH